MFGLGSFRFTQRMGRRVRGKGDGMGEGGLGLYLDWRGEYQCLPSPQPIPEKSGFFKIVSYGLKELFNVPY